MTLLLILLVVAVLALVGTVFLLGFQAGGATWQARLLQVRMEAAQAERSLHDLTRSAFVAMAERAEQLRRPNQ